MRFVCAGVLGGGGGGGNDEAETNIELYQVDSGLGKIQKLSPIIHTKF